MQHRTAAMIAAAALAIGYPAAAEPTAPDARAHAAAKVELKAEAKPAELELQLAHREDLKQPAAAPKRRAARASSCRCGDLSSQQR